MSFRVIVVLCSLLCANAVLAEWRFSPTSHTVFDTPTAFGVSVEGTKALALTCVDGKPLIYVHGYLAVPDDNRQDSFTVAVGGQRFTVTGEHAPSDGLWSGRPSARLIDALKRGRTADVVPAGQEKVRIALKGSSKAIDTALRDCTSIDDADPTRSLGGETGLTRALVSKACGGDYRIADGAELTGNLDGDDKPDIVLDWAGVSCADASKGRGAGYCGINTCTIEVFFTETQQRQQILGLKPQILPRGFGRPVLRTLALRPSCPRGALECSVDWRWTGGKLEAVR